MWFQEKLSGDQQKTALPFTPTLIEIAGHTYFPASFMVGPQFSMRRYLDFVKVNQRTVLGLWNQRYRSKESVVKISFLKVD